MGYPRNNLEKLKQDLKTLPKPDIIEVSKRQAIRMLAPTIQEMLRKGYSVEKVADFLSKHEHGIAIRPATLKNYLRTGKSSANPKRKETRPKANEQQQNQAERNMENETLQPNVKGRLITMKNLIDNEGDKEILIHPEFDSE